MKIRVQVEIEGIAAELETEVNGLNSARVRPANHRQRLDAAGEGDRVEHDPKRRAVMPETWSRHEEAREAGRHLVFTRSRRRPRSEALLSRLRRPGIARLLDGAGDWIRQRRGVKAGILPAEPKARHPAGRPWKIPAGDPAGRREARQ